MDIKALANTVKSMVKLPTMGHEREGYRETHAFCMVAGQVERDFYWMKLGPMPKCMRN